MVEDNSEFQNKKKSHRERNAGRKAEKKKSKKEAVNPVLEQPDKQRNPKAFAFHSAVRAERRFRRKQDIETKKQHIPVVDRTPIEPSPILVAVVGPPKVGKSTVINNLIKLFTKSPLTDIKGPVTIVTGKKRRITLIECNNDINSMIDIAKVADLVLLLCDASFGFEMEIFEFLNICQVHGMPRIMGVLTHLDMIKNSKTLKNTKKILKHRFWTEVYSGAKLFYLSGIIHGEYLRNEIKNLGRFISVMKFRSLTWRSTHSYLLGDRIEDLTNQEFIRQNPKCDRTISLYGYIRGVPLAKNTSVHVAGLGDLKIADISFLPDPCPLPDTIKKRALIEKEKFIYAPFSGVGGIVYDKDAVYVELGGSHSHKKRQEHEDESKNLMSNLIDTRQTLDAKMERSEMQIFTGGKKLTAKDVEITKNNEKSTINLQQKDTVDSDLDDELDQLRNKSNFTEEKVNDSGRTRRKVIFENNDDDFIKTIHDESDDDSSDSEVDDHRKETEYTVLKENKDKNVLNAVTGALKYLEKKSQSKRKESDSELDSNLSESDSDESHESLVGVSGMKKKKDKLIDVSFEATANENKKKKAKEQVSKTDRHEHSSDSEESQSESEAEPEMSLKKNQKSKLGSHTTGVDKKNGLEDKKQSERNKTKTKMFNETSFSMNEDESGSEDEESSIEEDGASKKKLVKNVKKSSTNESSGEGEDLSEEDSDGDNENGAEEESTDDSEYDDLDDSQNKLQEMSSDDSDDADDLKWKENLVVKARNAFLDRQKTTQNVMKLVYGIFDKHSLKLDEEEQKTEDKDREEIGGLFHLVTHEQKRITEEKEKLNVTESSLFNTWDVPSRDWTIDENKDLIINCFVTGKWKESEDAKELLRLDEMEIPSDNDSEVFGDFEDLETGEKHSAEPKEPKAEKRKRDTESEPLDKEALIEKKRKLKEKFDSEYDNGEKNTFYDDLKTSAEKQAQLNKSVFENMADDLRVQIEGYRAGMYVRIEFENVPSEFINNFDPTFPIVIGGLNMGEENIGYVNVKIKKHRWYKKILKTTDPLIISMGWRRFQTIPLFSKLEDDLKYRYLKYTPEHIQCNAHFWGPITPQSTGFLAIQSCENDQDSVKKQGFRIAATGSVQELEKSTQIMKKLKLIGYPLKIYKKTAFIKDMFTSALEVAKFEGARIKTVSGIRGQIKKAVSKPEGAFRATFEDKIQLSDIVFCRTWYKVDVPHFYCPVTNLLLPAEKKLAWKGVRTTGQIKRDKQVQNQPNPDSLYTEIERQPKVFKPLIIPRKLNKDLPYRDKPKYGPLKADRKPDIEKKRIAVVREPYEQKVAEMLKMLRTSYEQKQDKLKKDMSERMAQHQAMIEGQEAQKQQREKQKRKDIFRNKSKAKIREEKRAAKGK